MEKHRTDIADGIMWVSGALRPFAEFQTSKGAAVERYEAAALAATPFGGAHRSVQDQLSFSRRPAGVVGVIAPFNVPMAPALRAVAPSHMDGRPSGSRHLVQAFIAEEYTARLAEGGPQYSMHPETLEMYGSYDFHGGVDVLCTAHSQADAAWCLTTGRRLLRRLER